MAVVVGLDSGHLRESSGSDLGSREGPCQSTARVPGPIQGWRSQRRAAAGGGSAGRRGSSSGTLSSYRLMESPMCTRSSGSHDRDTPMMTVPTSIGSPSASPFGFFVREKEKQKEEIRELKEKHLTETSALLGVLSDSQRTTRMLREENGELRERIDQLGTMEMENEGLRQTVGDYGDGE